MVPLVKWGQETWQMINCRTCARVHTHTYVKDKWPTKENWLQKPERELISLTWKKFLKCNEKVNHKKKKKKVNIIPI